MKFWIMLSWLVLLSGCQSFNELAPIDNHDSSFWFQDLISCNTDYDASSYGMAGTWLQTTPSNYQLKTSITIDASKPANDPARYQVKTFNLAADVANRYLAANKLNLFNSFSARGSCGLNYFSMIELTDSTNSKNTINLAQLIDHRPGFFSRSIIEIKVDETSNCYVYTFLTLTTLQNANQLTIKANYNYNFTNSGGSQCQRYLTASKDLLAKKLSVDFDLINFIYQNSANAAELLASLDQLDSVDLNFELHYNLANPPTK